MSRPDPTADRHVLLDADGVPAAVLDTHLAARLAAEHARDLAAVATDPVAVAEVQCAAMDRVGVEAYPLVALAALRVLAVEYLGPAMDVIGAFGVDDLQEALGGPGDGGT